MSSALVRPLRIKGTIMDRTTTVSELRDLVEQFVTERDWAQFHSPKNLAMALSIEAAELMDLFKWQTVSESINAMKQAGTKRAAADEIADVIIYSLAFANRNRIDVSGAVTRKIDKNRKKYPEDKFRGKF